MRNDEKTPKAAALSAVRGVLIGFAVCGALFALASYLVSSGRISESGMRPAAAVCAFIAAGAGGFAASRGLGRRLLLTGALTGAVMFIVCAAAQLMINAAGFPSGWTAALLVSLILGGALGGLCSAKRGARRRR